MAKKHIGRFIAMGLAAGAAATVVSYFLKYKSFHKELEEDFHDFEDDAEHEDNEFEDMQLELKKDRMTRNYVSLSTDKDGKAVTEQDEAEDKKVGESSPKDGDPAFSASDEAMEDGAVGEDEDSEADEQTHTSFGRPQPDGRQKDEDATGDRQPDTAPTPGLDSSTTIVDDTV